jgi:hypothetical protein
MAGSRRTVDWWKSSQSLPKTGRRHQVDGRSSHSQTGLSSLSRQEIATQSTEGGCRHQVSKKGMSSPSRQEVVTQSTEGAGTPSQPRSGDTKSTQGAGTPSQPRSGDTKSTHGKRGGDTKSTHGERGDTKSTHGKREGTPSQPTEKSQGVSTDRRGRLGGKRRAHNLLKAKEEE